MLFINVHYNSMFHLCAICRTHDTYATHVPWHFTRACMIPCSSRVKCHAWDVPCVFHGILHVKVHVHTLRETWSTQTRDVNLEYLCRVSLRVHASKSEVINERYCILALTLFKPPGTWICSYGSSSM